MVKLLKIVVIVVIFCNYLPAHAREVEPDNWPRWATPKCLLIIQKIVMHETGNMKSDEVFEFMTNQIINDLKTIKCENLTDWRWRIGDYPEHKISNQVKLAAINTILFRKSKYIICKFIGQPADISVWESYGYNTKIGFKRTVNNLTVVGVNCAYNNIRQQGIKNINTDSNRINNFNELWR